MYAKPNKIIKNILDIRKLFLISLIVNPIELKNIFLFEIINKFFLFQIEQFNIKLKLQFKLDSNFKLITIHRLILEFFSLSKKINLIKFKLTVIEPLLKGATLFTLIQCLFT